MADIEIISVRLNLKKDDDRRLFDLLQKRVSQVDQSRNEFLKRLLLGCLSGCSLAKKPAALSSEERQPCRPADRSGSNVPKPGSNPAVSRKDRSNPAGSPVPSGASRENGDNHGESDSETAALVASLVS